jgi:hypothetical protein
MSFSTLICALRNFTNSSLELKVFFSMS